MANTTINTTSSLDVITTMGTMGTSLYASSTTANNSGLDPGLSPQDYSLPHIILSSIFMILILLCTLIGNLLVILAFRTYYRLQVVTNFFIVSLACADILVALFSMPVWITNIISQGELLLDHEGLITNLWTASDILSSSASIMHLTVVSIDRFLCITYPFKYHEYMTKTKAKIIIFFIWVCAVFLSCTLIIQIHQKFDCGNCYPVILASVIFILPLSVIMLAYLKIFQIARHQAKSLQLTVDGKTKKFSLSKELRAAKTLGIVIGAFVFCWLPFFSIMFMIPFIGDTLFYSDFMTLFIDISKWLHYGNSMLNPIIYSCKNREFSRAFSDLIMRRCLGRQYKRRRSNTSEYTMDAHANYV